MTGTATKDTACLSTRKLSKKFCKNLRWSICYGMSDIVKSIAGIRPDTQKLRKYEFWAVSDCNLDLHKGDVLGIVGPNGSGKTSLLRILAGIFPPDRGEAVLRGRIASLLSIQAGFHFHMSVRENIYLNGTILGMTRREIEDAFSFILEFSGIEDFVEAPVAVLSAGMFVRLSFSIAIAVKPDIFLIDEVLAVADKNFREQYLDEIKKLSSDMAIVFVSHNMDTVLKICNRIAVMERGKIVFISDDVSTGIEFYSSRKTS